MILLSLDYREIRHNITVLQPHANATDQQLDKLVFELYDLTEENIRLIEEMTDK